MAHPTIKSNFDIDGARALVGVGFPDVLAHADEIVEWCIEPNDPVAHEVLIPFCVAAGESMLPAIRSGMKTLVARGDFAAVYSLLEHVVGHWPRETVLNLREDLLQIAADDRAPKEGHAAAALALLAKMRIAVDSHVVRLIPGILGANPHLLDQVSRESLEWLERNPMT